MPENLKKILIKEFMVVILLALSAFIAILNPIFLSPANIVNILRYVSILGVTAFGMTMVIIMAEIDLSVGSAIALSGCVFAVFIEKFLALSMGSGMAVFFAAILACVIGFSIGSFTGFIRSLFNVPTFIITLGMFTALRGIAYIVTDGFPVSSFPEWFKFVGSGSVLGIPFAALVFLIVFVCTHFIMNYTSFGRSVYAVGGNAEAARLSGINVTFIRVIVMANVGFLAAISGILQAAKIGSGTPTVGKGMELDIISAVIIGGTSLFGGRGRIWGTFIGLIFIGVVTNGLTLLNVPEYFQMVVKGALILIAVLVNRVIENLKK
jgi:ribose/xylose/arabinose/galactoside ABC-type transport system permease subunit